MNTISAKDFLNKMNNIENYSIEIALQIIDSEADYVTDLNKNQIFFDSIQSDGKKITKIGLETVDSFYSKTTELLNKGKSFRYKGISKKKIEGKEYHLKDTGEFFNSFKVKTDKDNFKIISNKQNIDMQKNFGKNLIGLTKESIEFLKSEVLIPQLTTDLQNNYFK